METTKMGEVMMTTTTTAEEVARTRQDGQDGVGTGPSRGCVLGTVVTRHS